MTYLYHSSQNEATEVGLVLDVDLQIKLESTLSAYRACSCPRLA